MSVMDSVKLLEQRTQKAASLIKILRNENATLQEQLKEERQRPTGDPETEAKLAQATADLAAAQNSLSQEQAKSASLQSQIDELQKKFDELEANYNLVVTHNGELEDYVEKFQTSNKLIEESINAAMKNLDSIEGLDDTPLAQETGNELETAEGFTAGGALSQDQMVDDDVLGDLDLPQEAEPDLPADDPSLDDLPEAPDEGADGADK